MITITGLLTISVIINIMMICLLFIFGISNGNWKYENKYIKRMLEYKDKNIQELNIKIIALEYKLEHKEE